VTTSRYNHFATPENISWERPLTERTFVQIVKFPPSVVSESASKTPLLHSSFQTAHVVMKRKKTFCEGEFVIKPVGKFQDRNQFAAWHKAYRG